VEQTAFGEIGAAVPVGREVVDPAERAAVGELVGDRLALGRQLDDLREDRAVGAQAEPGIAARAVGGERAALGVDRDRSGTGDERPLDPPAAVGPDLDDRIALFLGEWPWAAAGAAARQASARAADAIAIFMDLPLRRRSARWC
jgi:hypothetical protein